MFWCPDNGRTTQATCPHCIFVGHATKRPKTAVIWPKILVLGQIWPSFGQNTIFWAVGVKLLLPSYNHLGVPNNVQPSLGNIEPVLGVHATKRQKIPYLGTMPFCEFKMAKTAFLSTCLIFATVQAH